MATANPLPDLVFENFQNEETVYQVRIPQCS